MLEMIRFQQNQQMALEKKFREEQLENGKQMVETQKQNGEKQFQLKKYFEEDELPELLSLINSGPNSFKEEESEVWENVTYLVPTKVSNLTQDFGTMLDTAGEERIAWGERSGWAYCDWKMAHIISDYPHEM